MNSEVTEKTDIKEVQQIEHARTSTLATLSVSPFRGWILYDGKCPSCTASARRFSRVFRRRGYLFLPLQTEWVMQRLALEPGAPLEEMHVLTNDSRDIAGADAVIFLARQIWWAWPVVAFAQLPGMHELLDRGYRWIAAHRDFACCVSDWRLRNCRFRKTAVWRQPRQGPGLSGGEPLLEVFPAWIALLGLPISVLPLRDRLAPWQFMWLMAGAIFFGCKWLTAWRAQKPDSHLKLAPTLGYFFAWPGMDAEKFLSRHRQPWRDVLPLVLDVHKHVPPFVAPMAKIFLGAVLLFGVARFAHPPLLAGWMGMIGMILILHFGMFQLLALAWRRAGIDVEPIMNAPLRSKSISEFWGRRWNAAFNRLAFDFVFRPFSCLGGRSSGDAETRSRGSSTLQLSRGTTIATLAAFLVSGFIHELVISLPARAGYGLPTAYFLLQSIGILTERTLPNIRGRLLTFLIVAGPAFWLFHPPFVHNVIVPFMKAIGAL